MQTLKPALQSSQGRSLPWSGANLLNAFSEKADGDKRNDFAVMLIPGTVTLADLGTDPVRGIAPMDESAYAVIGTTLYLIDSIGNATALGAIPGSGRVRIVASSTQVAIVSDSIGYVLSAGVIATPAGLPSVSDVAFLNGYFIWTSDTYDQYVYTNLDDGTIYNGNVTSVEGSPDGLVGVMVDHLELLFFGKRSVEIDYATTDADAPFARQGNAFVERGCFGRDTIVKIDNTIMFMGEDRIIYRLDGYTPTRISTHAEEYKLRSVTDAWAFTYTQEGHKFYCLNTDQGTLCFDVATGAWADRGSHQMDYWRVGCGVTLKGGTIWGDSTTGKLYRPSFDVYTENGDPIEMVIDLPTLDNERERMTMYAFELLAETGVGNSDAPDPQVALSYSDDGGRTYSNELWRSLGAVGEYLTRAIWRRIGHRFRQRSMRLRITDPCRRFVFGYFADIAP